MKPQISTNTIDIGDATVRTGRSLVQEKQAV
jgi:hypothetical protein